MGQANLFLPAQIQQKIDELTAHPNAPLLLAGTSLETAFLRSDNMDMLYGIEGAYFVPVQRHAPLSLAPLVSYISEHYVRTKTLDNDEYSIWEPKAVQGGSAAGGSGGSK